MNKVILMGRFTKEPELIELENGGLIAKCCLAKTKRYKKQNGEVVEDKLFIDVVAFNGLADVISKYTKKGSQILIAGELKLETWVSQDGSKKSKHIVQIDDIALLDKKEE